MGLRPGRAIRKIERPWTRVSHHVPRKSYVKGVPFPKTHQFEMGNRNGSFDTSMYLVADRAVQMRDNSIEAGRIVAVHFLDAKLTTPNYFLKILVYPHHVIREKPIATGAGADRYSQGMAHPFGKPTGSAVQVRPGQRLLQLRVGKQNISVAKLALKKFALKISTPTKIIIEE
jgi:large subunit ribosomal protein L10e